MGHSRLSDDSPCRLAVLISGRGSNMLAIADACRDGRLNAVVGQVISNNPDARGLEAAASRGIDTCVVDHRHYHSRAHFDQALNTAIQAAKPDWIVLAGFMRILGPVLIREWQGKILNIHPSLLPKYPGLDTHARALEAGDTEAGATVHIVTEALDAGPIIGQASVPILAGDTADTLAQRVLGVEHELYISCLRELCAGDDSGRQR